MRRKQLPCCDVQDLHVHYGKSHILQGVTFAVGKGEVISLLGPQRLRPLHYFEGGHGACDPDSRAKCGSNGRDLSGARPYRVCRSGISFVPEEREIFANLTVDENLRMGEQPRRQDAPAWTSDQMFDYFPLLKQRRKTRAGNLSGGEQQMLTICRSLLGNPELLLIDEPTEGLAPKIVAVVRDAIRDIHRRGVSVVLVEQKLTIALKVSTHVCVMGHGRIVFRGTPDELTNNPQLLKEWLAV